MESGLQYCWAGVGRQMGAHGSGEEVEARVKDSRLWWENGLLSMIGGIQPPAHGLDDECGD